MITHLVIVVLLLRQTFACGQMQVQEEEFTFANTEYEGGYRQKRDAADWNWIRIELDYDSSVQELSEEKRKLLEQLITDARDYIESTFKVQRLASLQLPSKCAGNRWRMTVFSICDYECERRCGTAIASNQVNYFAPCRCGGIECIPNRSKWGGSLHNADFALFVSARNRNCGMFTLAYASFCANDRTTKRPVAGFINICPKAFNDMRNYEVAQWKATIEHELIHALVFQWSLFKSFVGAGPAQASVIPGIVERITRTDWETAEGSVEHEVYMMVTPRVREEAREYFNCSDLEGAEIENQGGTGTALSHWEKRVFENEAMSGYSTQVFAISRITLAVFEDSGWYKPNYDKAHIMTWGRGLGCEFAKRSCLSWMKSHPKNPYPFCTTYEHARCSPNRKSKMRCNMVVDSKKPPSQYDYNIHGLYFDKRGHQIRGYGHIDVADYCPYYRVVETISKTDADTRCTFFGNMHYSNYSLEVFSPTSRCFELDNGVDVTDDRGTVTWAHYVACFETACKNNTLLVKTQRSQFYPCFWKGQRIHIEKRLQEIGTVRMRIICPSCDEICGDEHCNPEVFIANRIGDPTRAANQRKYEFILKIVVFMLLFY